MRHLLPLVIAGLAVAACSTAPPRPGFAIEVSVNAESDRQVCVTGKNFTPGASVQTGFIDIPARPASIPALTAVAGPDGAFKVIDVSPARSSCSQEDMKKEVIVFAKDTSNGNVAIGRLPATLWCATAITLSAIDSRCP